MCVGRKLISQSCNSALLPTGDMQLPVTPMCPTLMNGTYWTKLVQCRYQELFLLQPQILMLKP